MQSHIRQLGHEAKNFSLTSLAATGIDYVLFNLMTLLLHLPPIPSNAVSTTISSFASYRMNVGIVFEGRRYGIKQTIMLYVVITAVGIYVIQSICLLLFGRFIENIAATLPMIVRLNAAKIGATLVAGIWNYLMLRYVVFVPETKKDSIDVAD